MLVNVKASYARRDTKNCKKRSMIVQRAQDQRIRCDRFLEAMMSNEANEYHSSVRAFVILGLGGAGATVGAMLPIAKATMFGINDVVSAALLGLVAGFFVGASCGLLLSWMVRASSTDLYNRVSRGPQLVGQRCVFCRKPIGNIAEGKFCQDCHCPMHYRCAPILADIIGTQCPNCGADPSGALSS